LAIRIVTVKGKVAIFGLVFGSPGSGADVSLAFFSVRHDGRRSTQAPAWQLPGYLSSTSGAQRTMAQNFSLWIRWGTQST
jgi:hypothetical protein